MPFLHFITTWEPLGKNLVAYMYLDFLAELVTQ